MASAVESLDAQIAALLADWSALTTFIALALVGFITYPILFPNEPDTHPLLLARQSSPAPVRNKNESALYRSPEVPHGYPLKTGLGVKEPGAPRWASGKDGDLRDVWREVQRGGQGDVAKGKILTVLGREEVVEHSVEDLSCEIGTMGRHFEEKHVTRVAVYLPNSAEYLLTIFGVFTPPSLNMSYGIPY